ncbi:MAG: hypothetical protein Q4E34_02250 [Synergistaceae bacterium]|nr:hypothetical protein [Synergistaceae bacterium]
MTALLYYKNVKKCLLKETLKQPQNGCPSVCLDKSAKTAIIMPCGIQPSASCSTKLFSQRLSASGFSPVLFA